jgi:hypothetical protein
MYEHIVRSELDRGADLQTAKRIAAATVRARQKNETEVIDLKGVYPRAIEAINKQVKAGQITREEGLRRLRRLPEVHAGAVEMRRAKARERRRRNPQTAAEKVAYYLSTRRYKVSGRAYEKCKRKIVKVRGKSESDAIAQARKKFGAGYDDFKVMNPYKRVYIRNPKTGQGGYFNLVIEGTASTTPKGDWKVGPIIYKRGKGTKQIKPNKFLDLGTGFIYSKEARNRSRRNIAMGAYGDGVFHPIRASWDYDPSRAGEGRDSSGRRYKVQRTKVKRYKEAMAKASATNLGKRAATVKARKKAERAAAKKKAERSARAKAAYAARKKPAKKASRVTRSAAKKTTARQRSAAKTAAKRRRRNIAMGAYGDGVFHPIRASWDYDPSRAGEGYDRSGRRYKVQRTKVKRYKEAMAKASATNLGKRAATVKARKKAERAAAKKKAERSARSKAAYAKRKTTAKKATRVTRSASKKTTARSRGATKTAAKRRRRNQASPESIRRQFAGYVSGERDLFFPEGTPQGLAKLGKLVSITTEEGTIKPVAGTAWLCSDTHGKLHLGSTTHADLYSGPKRNFGEVSKVEYEDYKKHLGYTQPVIWFHHLGEKNGIRPTLCADGEGGLVFKGGDYYVGPRGLEN